LLDKVYSMQGIFDQLSNHQFLKKASAPWVKKWQPKYDSYFVANVSYYL
jgi:hypothetical protein